MPMTMEQYLDLFLDYLTVERGLAVNTRASYSSERLDVRSQQAVSGGQVIRYQLSPNCKIFEYSGLNSI